MLFNSATLSIAPTWEAKSFAIYPHNLLKRHKKDDFNHEYFFFKSNPVDCKIELEKSKYGSKSLLEYLSIMPSGKIANPQYENKLLRKIHEHREQTHLVGF